MASAEVGELTVCLGSACSPISWSAASPAPAAACLETEKSYMRGSPRPVAGVPSRLSHSTTLELVPLTAIRRTRAQSSAGSASSLSLIHI